MMKWYTMRGRKRLFQLCTAITISGLVACGGVKSALSALEKGKYPRAQEQLARVASKDSLPVGTYYAYSQLYTDSAYARQDIDTAYQYIQQAIELYQRLGQRQREKLSRRLSLDTVSLQRQRLRLDSLAYERATQQHQRSAYQRFINRHASAPQLPQAIAYRNQLAFDSVQQIDTYAAYKSFMKTYPKAEQLDQARQRYNTLAFQELTREGDLESYLHFLENYPRSPYRAQAEQAILEISTADNQAESYLDFARRYPRSPWARRAVNVLFHQYSDAYPSAAFLQAFPDIPFADSLRQVIRTAAQTLAPVWENEGYGLIDGRGQLVAEARYDYLPTDYFCRGIPKDFVHAGTRENSRLRHQILTKAGAPVFSLTEPLDTSWVHLDETITDLGAGLLEITSGNKYSIQHKAGHPVIPASEQVAEIALIATNPSGDRPGMLPYQFIKFRVGERWGLKSFLGRTLLEPVYTSIEDYGPFLVLSQGKKLAVTHRQRVLDGIDGSLPPPDFAYDDIALLSARFLLVYQGPREGVLDEQLNSAVPLSDHRVVRHLTTDSSASDRWLMKQTDTVQRIVNDSLATQLQTTYYLYPPLDSLGTNRFTKVSYNDRWLAAQRRQNFLLLDYRGGGRRPTTYDSVQILGEGFALVFPKDDQDSVEIQLAGGGGRKLTPSDTATSFRLLRTKGVLVTDRWQEYLLATRADGSSIIMNARGNIIYEQPLTEATVYPTGMIAVRRGQSVGLIDSTGQELLPPRYDGIGNYQAPGTLSLFEDQKFGLYQYPSTTVVPPRYESALTRYATADSAAQSRFVARKNERYGIITATDQVVVPFAFERVVYWNDTSALVKADDQWMIYRLSESVTQPDELDEADVLYGGIEDFSFFREDQDEQLLRIYAGQSYGVLSSQRGEVLPPAYDGVLLFGDDGEDDYLFVTEKYVPEAQLYIMVYFNAEGDIVKRLALTPEQYDKMYCE